MVQNDEAIDFNWGSTSPIPGVLPDNNYSIRWTQTPNFVSGNYLFKVVVEGGVRVWLDGQIFIDSWENLGVRELQNTETLNRGGHSLRVEYFKETGNAQSTRHGAVFIGKFYLNSTTTLSAHNPAEKRIPFENLTQKSFSIIMLEYRKRFL